jgi:hypothetical protein
MVDFVESGKGRGRVWREMRVGEGRGTMSVSSSETSLRILWTASAALMNVT